MQSEFWFGIVPASVAELSWLRCRLRLRRRPELWMRVELLRFRLLQVQMPEAKILEESLPHAHQEGQDLLWLLQAGLQSLRNDRFVPSRAVPLQALPV